MQNQIPSLTLTMCHLWLVDIVVPDITQEAKKLTKLHSRVSGKGRDGTSNSLSAVSGAPFDVAPAPAAQ